MQKPIEITGLFLRTEGVDKRYIVVELEIDGAWHEIIKERLYGHEGEISIIIEPLGIRDTIQRGKPLP